MSQRLTIRVSSGGCITVEQHVSLGERLHRFLLDRKERLTIFIMGRKTSKERTSHHDN